jgi:hypothetical protein
VQQKLKVSLNLAGLTALLLCLACTAAAQQIEANPNPFNANAYRVGERLTYNVNYSQFVSAAHVEVLVAGRDNFFGREGIQLRAHVETNGVVNVALWSINNDYTTYIFPDSGLPYRSQQVVRQAGRTSQASVDYNQPAGTDALPAELRQGESAGTLDLLSAVYRVRAMPLATGSSYLMSVRSGDQDYQAQIKVSGRQMIKTNVGSFNAIATRVNVKKGEDYDIRAYFSDDEWHVPVLITARYNGADIQVELSASALTAPARTSQTRGAIQPGLPPPVATPTPGTRGSANPVNIQTSATMLDLPFKVGEQLNYRVYLGDAKVQVGTMTFEVKSRGRYFNRDGLIVSASAQTGGPAAIAIKDQVTSYVDPATLLPFRTELNISEGKHRDVHTYNLDQDRGTATSETPKERVEVPVGTHDLISALYAIRTFDLTIQKSNAISMMATHRPLALLVKAARRETIELNGQKISAIVLELRTDDPQPDRLQIRIWIGDDARRLPLRLTAVTDLGPVRADLVILPAAAR